MIDEDVITINDFMRIYKLKRTTAYEIARRKDFPKFFVGNQLRFSRSAVEKYILEETKRKLS